MLCAYYILVLWEAGSMMEHIAIERALQMCSFFYFKKPLFTHLEKIKIFSTDQVGVLCCGWGGHSVIAFLSSNLFFSLPFFLTPTEPDCYIPREGIGRSIEGSLI